MDFEDDFLPLHLHEFLRPYFDADVPQKSLINLEIFDSNLDLELSVAKIDPMKIRVFL